jgi:uncharacterized protein YodC (DUF2158 family)
MTEFKVGEIVQLKSGGPRMTVRNGDVGGEVQCQWFAGSKLDSGFFPRESLMRVEEGEKSEKRKS